METLDFAGKLARNRRGRRVLRLLFFLTLLFFRIQRWRLLGCGAVARQWEDTSFAAPANGRRAGRAALA